MNIQNPHLMIATLGLLCLLLFQVSGQEKPKPRPVDLAPPLPTPRRDLSMPTPEPLPKILTDRPIRPVPTPTPTPEIGCSTCLTVPLIDLGPKTRRFEVMMADESKSREPKAIFSVSQNLLGIVTITAEFKDAETAPEGTRYVVWARSPDDEFIPLGEFKDPPSKVTFKRDLNLNRSGFFITLERSDKKINFESGSQQPSSNLVGVAQKPVG